jgi:hypothetical protein
MNRTRLLSILSVLCVLPVAASPLSAEEKLTDLPVARVVLFSGGVAYFEHVGKITGDAVVRLTFKADQINDVLKSMHVSPGGGGSVTGISYPSNDPQQRALRSFAVDLSGQIDLADLLRQLRGAGISVKVAGSGTVAGKILSLELRTRDVNTAGTVTTIRDTILNLVTPEGIRALPMSQISSYALADARLSGELDKALEMLLGEHDTQRRAVDVHFTGQAEREVRIGYLVEAPVWKTTYRLDVTGAKPALQGWATVDNESDFDWSRVDLTLVAGRPVSFVQDIYRPQYAARSIIKPQAQAEEKAAIYEKTGEAGDKDTDKLIPPGTELLERADGARSLVGRLYGRRAVEDERRQLLPEDRTSGGGQGIFEAGPAPDTHGLVAAAEAKKVGQLFHFRVKTPVDLPRRRSSMLLIVSQPMTAMKVSVFDPIVLRTQPMNGVLLTNETDLELPGGPVAIFEADGFAGEAVMGRLAPRARTVLSYSVDADTTIQADANQDRRAVAAGILNSRLAVRTIGGLTRQYKITREVQEPRTLLLRLGRYPHERLISPEKCEDTTLDEYRVLVDLKGKGEVNFAVRTEEDSFEEAYLEDSTSYSVTILAADANDVAQDVRTALKKIVAIAKELNEMDNQAAKLAEQAKALPESQARLRDNIKALDPASPLVKRYVEKLSAQEDQIEKLEKQLADLKARIEAKRKELLEFLKDLKVGKMPQAPAGANRSVWGSGRGIF